MAQTKTENANVNVTLNGKQAASSIKELQSEVRQYQAQWRKATLGTKEHAEATKSLKAAQQRLASYRAEVRATQSSWSRFTDNFNKYSGIAAGIVAASGGVILGIKSMAEQAREFEKSLANVYTLLSQDDFERFHQELEHGSKEIMKEYGFAFEDVNKAMFDAISAGVPAGEAIQFLHKTAQLAIGGVTDLGTAVDGTTTVINAFGRQISEVDEISAAFFTAQKFGKTTVAELSREIGKVAPTANLAGLSYQETLSAVAALTTGGIKTAEATTYLKASLQAVIKPTKEAEEVLRAYGVPVGIAEVQSAGLGNVLEKLNNVILENPDAIAKAIPAVEGLTGVAALSGKGLEKYSEILDQVNKDIGENSSLTQAFNKQMETSAQYTARAKQELILASITLGEQLQPVLGALIFKFSNLVKFLADLPRFWKENEEVILLVLGAIVALNAAKVTNLAITAKEYLMLQRGLGLKAKDAAASFLQGVKLNYYTAAQTAAAAGSGKFMTALHGIKGVMSGLLGPVGLVIAGITGLVTAIKLYDKYNSTSVRLDGEKKAAQEGVAEATRKLNDAYKVLHGSVREMNRLSVEEKKQLRENIMLKLQEAEAELLLAKQKQDQIRLDNMRTTVWQDLKNSVISFGSTTAFVNNSISSAISNSTEAAGELDDEIKALRDTMEGFKTDMGVIEEELNAEAIADAIPTDSIASLNEKIGKYQTALNNAKIGSEDFLRIQKKIADADRMLQGKRTIIPDKGEQDKLLKDFENFIKEVNQLADEAESRGKGAEQKEVEAAAKKYEELLLKAEEYYKKNLLKKQEYDTLTFELEVEKEEALLEIRSKYQEIADKKEEEERLKKQEELAEISETIFQAGLSEQDRERREVELHYARLIELGKKHGLDITSLTEERDKKLAEIDKKYNQLELDQESELFDAKINLLRNFGSAASGFAQLIASNGNELAEFQKGLAAVQIGIDTAKSISSAIVGATAAAAAGGPAAPFLIGGYILSSIATITAAFSQAKQVFSTSEAPPIPNFQTGFKRGGYTGDGSVSDVAGVVHKGEYVVPNAVLSSPQGFSMVQALEAMRLNKGFFNGGPTSQDALNSGSVYYTTNNNGLNNGEEIVNMLSAIYEILKVNGKPVLYIGNKEAEEINELLTENTEIRTKSGL